jgi:hypothetical protein
MGRLVQPAQYESVRVPARGGLESAGSMVQVPVGGDGFADRIAKYIPGEVIAGYMAIDRSLVPSADMFKKTRTELAAKLTESAVAAEQTAMSPKLQLFLHENMPLVVLVMCLILTPLYIRQIAVKSGPGTPWATHALIATIAFFVWAYAIQGSAFTLGALGFGPLYEGGLAAALVAFFTLVSGLFSPAPQGGTVVVPNFSPPSRTL